MDDVAKHFGCRTADTRVAVKNDMLARGLWPVASSTGCLAGLDALPTMPSSTTAQPWPFGASLIAPTAPMSLIHLSREAQALPQAWQSRILGQAVGANIKVLRMDASSYPNEVHSFVEALLVLEGHMNLEIKGETVCVQAGELFMVPADTPHAVAAGSQGTLLIIDQ